MTMTITSPATPGTTSAASIGIAPAGQAGAREDFLLTGIVGRLAAPAGALVSAPQPGVPIDSAAQAPLFSHVMEATTEGAPTVAAPPAATLVKEPTDTDTDDTGIAAAAVAPAIVIAAVIAPALALPALAGNRYVAPAPVVADATASAAVSAVAGTSTGATLYPSATPFNLPAANIAVTTPSGAAPQASYTALQDASQLALAQQAARVTDDIGAPLRSSYGYASAVTPPNTQPVDATATSAVPPLTSAVAAAGMIAAVTNPGDIVADAAAPADARAATTDNAAPGPSAGLAKPFNPALAANAATNAAINAATNAAINAATNAAAMPDRQAGAASATTATTATAAADAIAGAASTTAAVAAPAAAAAAKFAASEYAAAAVATVAAEASGLYYGGRKAAAVTSAAPLPAATGTAASAAIASYPAADAAQPRVMPAMASASVDAAAAPVPVPANRAHGSGMASDDGQAAGKFTSALAATASATQPAVATAAPTSPGFTAPVKLAGAPEQWQQPLREALGDRLQVNLQRNNNQAVIRLDPPNMGSIEISIRQSAGALQVNLSASNSEVVRQLNAIGDSVRQDLATRQFSEVAVTVSTARTSALSSATPQQSYAQGQPDGSRQQQQEQERGRNPGRALYQDDAKPIFAMNDQE